MVDNETVAAVKSIDVMNRPSPYSAANFQKPGVMSSILPVIVETNAPAVRHKSALRDIACLLKAGKYLPA